MNKKLNLFEYYMTDDTFPIENNFTRNLAIILRSNPLCLDIFLRLIEENINKKDEEIVSIINNSIKVKRNIDIQKKIANLEYNAERVFGVILTTNKELNFLNQRNITNTKEGQITDLVIEYNSDLIIVEIKRNKEDARNQLENQLQEFRTAHDIDADNKIYLASITWDELIRKLMELNNLTNSNNYILNDYIEHIEFRAPAFLPITSFTNLNSDNKIQIEKRLDFISNQFVEEQNNFSIEIKGGKLWITSDNMPEFLKMFVLSYKNSKINFECHLGNNIPQAEALYKNNLSILNKSEFVMGDDVFNLESRPYLKIYNSWGSYINEVEIFEREPSKLRSMFSVLGKKFSNVLENDSTLNGLIYKYDKQLNVKQFETIIKELNHNTINLTISIHIKINDLFSKFKAIDIKEDNTENITNFIFNVYNQLIRMIEKYE